MRCRRCGQDLKEVTSNRCPECGTFFDPNHSRTFLTEPVSGLVALKIASMALGFVLLTIGANEIMQVLPPRWPKVLVAVFGGATTITAAVLMLATLSHGVRSMLGRFPWQVHHRCTVAAVVIAAASLMLFIAYTGLR